MKCSKKKTLCFLVAVIVLLVGVLTCAFYFPFGRKSGESSEITDTKRCSSGNCHLALESLKKPVRDICTDKDCLATSGAKTGALTRGMCLTEDCVMAAAKMLKWMDTKVDPCVNFFNFSCGKFLRTHTVPEGDDTYNAFHVAEEEVALKVKSILERPTKPEQSDALIRAKKLYKSCMNVSHIEEHTLRDLKYVLSGKGIGDWPFLNPDWKDCRLDLEWRMAKLNALGIESLFTLDIQFKGDNDRAYVYLKPAAPLVDGICDQDEDNITLILESASEDRKFLTTVLSAIGVQVDNFTEKDIDDLLEFDFTLCNITKASREISYPYAEPTSLNTTLKDIIDIAQEINWLRWRNIMFTELRLNFPYDKLNIYTYGLNNTIEDVIELLHNTTSKVLANYLTWKFVLHHLGYLGQPFRQIVENHPLLAREKLHLFMSSDRTKPRWQQCVAYVQELMPISILPLYLPNVLTPDVQRELTFVSSSVKNEFRDIFRKSEVLMRDEKVKSIHKIDQLNIRLFYPDREKKFFDNYYLEMGNLGDSFLKNGIKVKMSHTRKLMEGVFLTKSEHDLEFKTLIQGVFQANSFSGYRGNAITLGLGELQASRISSRLPRFLSMSSLGYTIGHELAHGFDFAAIKGSPDSLRYRWMTWPNYAKEYSRKKAQCFVDQYAKQETSNAAINANESMNVNENIADNQGVYLAYKAYMNYLLNFGQEKYLPGLTYSDEQLFFIRYAQNWCAVTLPNVEDAYHSPPPLRVNEVVKNLEAFSQSFRCTVGSPMNPREKCTNLWV